MVTKRHSPLRSSAVLIAASQLFSVSVVSPQELISVPGGRQALIRLMGHVDEGDDAFLPSLNRILLTQTRRDHEWKEIKRRAELVDYLRDLDGLSRKFSSTIRIGLDQKPLRKRFQALADDLGYKLRFKDGRLQVLPKEGEGGDRRRRLARALEWDLTAIGEPLTGGGETTLEILTDFVRAPFKTAGEWQAVTGGITQTTTLEEFVKDQRLGLVLEGRRRLSAESSALMAELEWNWLYERTPFFFFRYARSLRLEDGRLVAPGGTQSTAAWTSIVGRSPDQPVTFIRELMTKKNARGAYLWDSLAWVPDEVAQFYLGVGAASTATERKFAKRLYNRLDGTSHLDFDWPRGGDLGFGTFVRSVPLLPGQAGLDLPGGPGLWFSALRGSDLPHSPTALARLVRRGLESKLDEGDFLLKVLTEDVKVEGVSQSVLPRLIRVANMFGDERELLTPGNVVLLVRSSDHFPAALSILDSLTLTDPESVRDYLLAVAHLDALTPSVESELLLENFQGGVEWLHAMATAGKVAATVLENALRDWARLHLAVTEPFSAAPEQIRWIVDLLHELPAADEQLGGRGPLERTMIGAMIGPRDPQQFGWGGLEYEGRRGENLAHAMARNLVAQGIPSADQIEALNSEFERLAHASSAGDIDDAHLSATELLAILDSLPEVDLQRSNGDKELWSRIFTVDRTRVRTILRAILKQNKAKSLKRKAGDVARAEQLMAREIRPFLLAPAYLVAMGDEDNPLFAGPNLVKSHILKQRFGLDLVTDNPWTTTEVVASEHAELGSCVRGHLSGVSAALAEFSRATAGGSQTISDRVWFGEFRNTRWHLLDRPTSRIVFTLTEAGREILANAVEEYARDGGRYSDFTGRRIPRARLEAHGRQAHGRSLVSRSELFGLGLGALVGDAFDEPGQIEVSSAARARFDEAIAASGDDWRAKLDRVSASTPHLNGRSSPSVSYWPPYETLEHEITLSALVERQLLDVKLAVIEYLGRHRLPGTVGADLALQVLRDASMEMRLETFRDWEGQVQWVNELDDDYFDEKMRTCFTNGLYSARGF